MKISRLFEIHQNYQTQGLPGSFGDGYLIANNRIYKKVRTRALKLGYSFSHERDEGYENFPLLELGNLLRKKKFPYGNNAASLEQLSPAQRNVLTWADVDGNLRKNFVFHEAAHGIVHNLIRDHLGEAVAANDRASQQKLALHMLLEESFANTCELFGAIEATDQTHRVFYDMNSYICEFESRTHLKNATEDFGEAIVFHYFLLAYLHANFLRDQIGDSQFQEILRMIGVKETTAASIKNLRALGKIVFNLSERFRYQTTGFHLRLIGIQTPMAELFDFDFLKALQQEKGWPEFAAAVQEFAQ